MNSQILLRRAYFALSCSLSIATGYGQDPDESLIYNLPEFSVETASEDGTFTRSASLGAMRTAQFLEEIPITVTVIPQELIEAFHLLDPDQHAAYSASWLSGETEAGGGGGSRVRGFVPLTFRNGFSRTGVGEVVNIERTEIIKGPMSAMFGQSNPGGLINYVTRRARNEPSYRFMVMGGSEGYQRYQANITGPIVKDKLLFRIDTSYTDQEGQMDFWYNRTWALSGNLTWRAGPDTTIYFDVETLNRYMNRGAGGILNRYDSFYNPILDQTIANVIGGVGEDLVRLGFNQSGPYDRVDREIVTYDMRLEHRFNSSLALRANLQYWDREFDDYRWTWPQYYVDRDEFVGREPFRHYQPEDAISGQVDLVSSFWLGDWADNELLVTFDFSDTNFERQDTRMEVAQRNSELPIETRNLSPSNPVYYDYDRDSLTRVTSHTQRNTEMWAVMLRERMALLEGDLILFASGRYDRVKDETFNLMVAETAPNYRAGATNGLLSGSFGGNYKIVGNQLVAFVNRSSSYTPMTTVDQGTNQFVDPIKGVGYETGFRGRIWNDSVYWTASVYQIDRYNIPQRNPDFINLEETPNVPQFRGDGVERSKGWEIELGGNLTPNFTVRAAIGYNDATLHRFPDNPSLEGRKLERAPEMTANFMLSYRFSEGVLEGTTLGFSGRYQDSYYARFGGAGSEVTGTGIISYEPTQPYELLARIEEIRPHSFINDFFVQHAFDWGNSRNVVRLNVQNVFDRDEWTVTGRLTPGRQWRLSWTVQL